MPKASSCTLTSLVLLALRPLLALALVHHNTYLDAAGLEAIVAAVVGAGRLPLLPPQRSTQAVAAQQLEAPRSTTLPHAKLAENVTPAPRALASYIAVVLALAATAPAPVRHVPLLRGAAPEARSVKKKTKIKSNRHGASTPKKPTSRMPGEFKEWQSWSELVFLPQQKFLFCALPKSACTSWKQLLLRIGGSDHWRTTNSSSIHNPVQSGLSLLGVRPGMHPHDPAAQNMSDIELVMSMGSNITSAVIVRDPVTRLLSTYLDRCVDMGEWKRCFATSPISFGETVGRLAQRFQAPEGVSDVHFRRQTDMCGLRYMNYTLVGRFESLAKDSRTILEKAGLWEEFGRQGWGSRGDETFASEAPATSNHKQSHKTTKLVCKHYTLALLKRVHKLYHADFDAFGYRVKPWENACSATWLP